MLHNKNTRLHMTAGSSYSATLNNDPIVKYSKNSAAACPLALNNLVKHKFQRFRKCNTKSQSKNTFRCGHGRSGYKQKTQRFSASSSNEVFRYKSECLPNTRQLAATYLSIHGDRLGVSYRPITLVF